MTDFMSVIPPEKDRNFPLHLSNLFLFLVIELLK